MKNVKWLERIEVVDYDYRGYWQRSDGWDNIAEIKTASRIDVPAELSAVDGEIVIAGVAWAGDRRIRRVEVSLDDGRTWTPAVLRRELAPAAWRQWRLPGGRAARAGSSCACARSTAAATSSSPRSSRRIPAARAATTRWTWSRSRRDRRVGVRIPRGAPFPQLSVG